MKGLSLFTGKTEKLLFILACIFTVYFGCFSFPLHLIKEQPVYSQLFLYIVPYLGIALIFIGLYDKRPIKVFALTFAFSAVGLGCRFLLEYGEVSNTINFAALNVVVFLSAIPLFVTVAYMIVPALNNHQ